jgi:CobQ-like glutamine amidotransferase family enzyme
MNKLLKHTFKILELYPEQMNIYGDTGNSLILAKRIELYGLKAKIIHHNIGDKWTTNPDIILGGGGQDSGQMQIVTDLLSHKSELQQLAKNNVPMLVICGMYQLFGKYFQTSSGEKIAGLEIFDITTSAPQNFTAESAVNSASNSVAKRSRTNSNAQSTRIIGNIITQSDQFGKLIGYENHSGQTVLGSSAAPLSEAVLLGVGNSGSSKVQKFAGKAQPTLTEGCKMNNVIGTYLHGPVLPKNPALADFLIEQAAANVVGQPVQLTAQRVAEIDKLAAFARQFVERR